jgi:hypothetical protein
MCITLVSLYWNWCVMAVGSPKHAPWIRYCCGCYKCVKSVWNVALVSSFVILHDPFFKSDQHHNKLPLSSLWHLYFSCLNGSVIMQPQDLSASSQSTCTGSLLAEAVRFFGRKNPQHAFLRKGSKAICPMSQICGMSKNPIIYRGSRKL